jgi:hypothetical protein
VTVSSATGEVVVASCHGWSPTGVTSFTADGGQNSRILLRSYSGEVFTFGMSDEAGAASVTESWTFGNAGDWGVLGVRLAEASGGGATAAIAAYYNMLRNS